MMCTINFCRLFVRIFLFVLVLELQIQEAEGFIAQKSDHYVLRETSRLRVRRVEGSADAKSGHRRKNGRKKKVDAMVAEMGLKPVSIAPVGTNRPRIHTETGRHSVASAAEIDLATQLDYSRNGHAVLRNYVDASTLKKIRQELQILMAEGELQAWQQKVQVASDSPELAASCKTVEDCQKKLEELGVVASLPFLQYFNTWRKLPVVEELAYSLAESASILLDIPSVRLYQDSVFWKRVGDGPTPWHCDSRMAPFDTSHFVTFWIPLQDVPRDGTALLFCSKSHSDFALPYWNPIENEEDSEWNRLDRRYPKNPTHYMPMKLSDLTVHSGWTLHCADGTSNGGTDRMALAISYVDARAELRSDALDDAGKGDNEDRLSYQDWAHSTPVRMPFEHHDMVPIVWPPR
jgi:ectoine hydroxylase-related dioxygenase (phytanoyl-CoA dioxygenase family)